MVFLYNVISLLLKSQKINITRTKAEEGASISVISSNSQSLQARNAIFM